MRFAPAIFIVDFGVVGRLEGTSDVVNCAIFARASGSCVTDFTGGGRD